MEKIGNKDNEVPSVRSAFDSTNSVELMKYLLTVGLSQGWTPEDIRCAEQLTGTKCAWDKDRVH
jgi:hypothetical protein